MKIQTLSSKLNFCQAVAKIHYKNFSSSQAVPQKYKLDPKLYFYKKTLELSPEYVHKILLTILKTSNFCVLV